MGNNAIEKAKAKAEVLAEIIQLVEDHKKMNQGKYAVEEALTKLQKQVEQKRKKLIQDSGLTLLLSF